MIDAWVRVSLVGISLVTVEARVVVASINTYLKYSDSVSQIPPVATPPGESPRSGTFGSATSSRSALLRNDGDEQS